jgi:hypothetical protein
MPNHCERDLAIEGTKAEVERFLEFAKGENGEFDFNRFLPYPEPYSRLDAEARRWHEAHKDDKDMNARWSERPKDGFNSGGHEWCVKNWGTKWNAYRIRPTDLVAFGDEAESGYSFDTAWSPPLPVVKKASAMFPDLVFTLRYFERGMEFNGIYRCKGGEVERSESGPYFGDRGG